MIRLQAIDPDGSFINLLSPKILKSPRWPDLYVLRTDNLRVRLLHCRALTRSFYCEDLANRDLQDKQTARILFPILLCREMLFPCKLLSNWYSWEAESESCWKMFEDVIARFTCPSTERIGNGLEYDGIELTNSLSRWI